MTRADVLSAIEGGALWAIPGWPYWIRPLDGAIVNVRRGRLRLPRRSRGPESALVHSIGGTSRTVASLIEAALGHPLDRLPDCADLPAPVRPYFS